MWPIYNIVTTQDEGGKTYLNLHHFKMVYHETLGNITFFFKTQNWPFILEKDLKFVMHKVWLASYVIHFAKLINKLHLT
jgi:hypothetical protein